MYRLLSIVTLAVLTAVPALSQNRAWTGRIAERLDLSDNQLQAIREHTADAQPNLWALAGALSEVLTPAQREQLLEDGRVAGAYRKGVRDGRTRQHARTRGQRSDRRSRDRSRSERRPMVDRLDDLTPEQKEAFETMRAEYRERSRALAEQRRAGELDRESFEAARRDMRNDMRDRAHNVLTQEQKQRLETMERRRSSQMNRTRDRSRSRDSALQLTEEQQQIIEIHGALAAILAPPRMAANDRHRMRRR
ncbi:MAG: hypothetical protein JJ896_16160 [Rhodothermales bacterium]|nr:hypothetical protein [Rhodothermales bacterium]MBO6781190.1 hypothetical protein [Rhodothermales bacterium]